MSFRVIERNCLVAPYNLSKAGITVNNKFLPDLWSTSTDFAWSMDLKNSELCKKNKTQKYKISRIISSMKHYSQPRWDKKRRQKAKLLRSYASRDDLSVISDKNTGTRDMIQIITWVEIRRDEF